MTDSMNFGPEWLRNLSSEGSTTGISTSGTRYQLAEYRYGREEMLALFEKGIPPPNSLSTFSPLFSEQPLPPLALTIPSTDEERQWSARGPPMGPSVRGGRGAASPGERGGRIARGGRGSYQPYGARNVGYESGGGGWGNGEQTEWSPRKDFNYSRSPAGGVDNWRRSGRLDEDDGWRSSGAPPQQGRGGTAGEKWSRSSSWREGDDERMGPQDKLGRSWHDGQRGPQQRRMWENEDHLPEWATENLGEGGGTFDASGAFHGSDDEQDPKGGGGIKKDHSLQKSASQQNITTRTQQQHAPLSTSKSALSLSKPPEPPAANKLLNKKDPIKELANHEEEPEKRKLPEVVERRPAKKEKPLAQLPKAQEVVNNKPVKQIQHSNINDGSGHRVVDEDFDKIQEDLVLKLVVDEEPSNSIPLVPLSNGIAPPPNMMLQEKWYYQDPQGDLQGPFLSSEMAEWFRAGYFSTTLYVRRQCDERFFTLGDLVGHCSGNPFQSTVPIPPLKQEKIPDEALQYHQLMQAQMALRAARPYGQGEPWNALNTLQQRELMTQQLLAAQSQIMPDPYIQQQPPTNPLIQMLNQLQQAKMPVPQPIVDKPPNTIPCQLDPLQALVHQMGGLQMQNRMQPAANLGPALAAQAGIKHESTLPGLHNLPVNGIPGNPVLPNANLISGMQKAAIAKMDGDNNMNFMQFSHKPQMEQSIDLESFWIKNQFANQQNNQAPPPPLQQQQQQNQWQQSNEKPISMWDMPTPPNHAGTPPEVHQLNKENANITKEKQQSDAQKEAAAKEEKKRKDAEEKQAKKDAEEKRKLEQKRQEAEKKQQEEKRRKEEERLKKEIEKAKKEAEEKRQRELAEKRRLKELRKSEEEARKKAEELKRMEDVEREKLASKEREEHLKKQAELARQAALAAQKVAKAAPWSQSSSNQGLSLAEIQKIERERKAEQVALMQQQRLQLQLQEQISPEKPANIHLNWANKPMKPNQVKSLAEIQAEEQERLLKQATEKATQQKEKETFSPPTSGIWSGQSLTWTNNENTGFWDEPQQQQQPPPPPQQKVIKVVAEPKVVKQNLNSVPKAVPSKPVKPKSKKDEYMNNNSGTDEFSDWCNRALASMNSTVDVPTFIAFLRDIESALDVREYCRDYLGDKPATQQFAAQFLEKRRLFKPKVTHHKDDMCSPAPAINPSAQHNNTDFQEVKGKGKKCKKSKMLKVDARILGFNVTAAQDRINVGDRDYGDTT